MSEEYEVPGHHEQHIEHEAQHGVALSSQIAIFTAIMATIGAVISYQSGHTQNEALYYKNDAVLNRTLSSDQWAFYQAKSIKEQLVETTADSTTDAQLAAKLHEKAAQYAKDKEEIKKQAEAYEEKAMEANEKAEHALHPHERLAFAMTLIQIAISAASIAALTRRRWLFGLAGLSATGGLIGWVLALFT
jgi:hypothetical protein